MDCNRITSNTFGSGRNRILTEIDFTFAVDESIISRCICNLDTYGTHCEIVLWTSLWKYQEQITRLYTAFDIYTLTCVQTPTTPDQMKIPLQL